ncbi:hypothetical protein [Paludisphaera mucosa]|uniref:BON domain-containing protein n=1 Tax=Paludisphaera mucosa TaxID=3030827 RepID=A0ABT6FCC5_9BACT|nr:hypothetical protein [Paludisphaera mucosa]MDG3005196.1 hypothetical protein [Paludisphaera mucosa]
MRRALCLAGILAAIACGGIIGFVSGAIVGVEHLYRRYTDLKLGKHRPILREPQFASVEIEISSAAQVYLMGRVDSREAYKSLEERVRFLFGDEEARDIVRNVSVSQY